MEEGDLSPAGVAERERMQGIVEAVAAARAVAAGVAAERACVVALRDAVRSGRLSQVEAALAMALR